MIRSPLEFERVVGYILNNPVKAGLAAEWGAWPWTWIAEGLLAWGVWYNEARSPADATLRRARIANP